MPDVLVVTPPIIKVLEFPFTVPAVRVQSPLKVWVRLPVPGSKFKVPPELLIIKELPDTLPVKVAVPVVLVIETFPNVVNPAMLWAAIVFVITIGELPAVKVPPVFTKLPPKVSWLFPVIRVPPLMVNGTFTLKTFGTSIVIAPVLAITTPPAGTNGVIHSIGLAVLGVVVLY